MFLITNITTSIQVISIMEMENYHDVNNDTDTFLGTLEFEIQLTMNDFNFRIICLTNLHSDLKSCSNGVSKYPFQTKTFN